MGANRYPDVGNLTLWTMTNTKALSALPPRKPTLSTPKLILTQTRALTGTVVQVGVYTAGRTLQQKFVTIHFLSS